MKRRIRKHKSERVYARSDELGIAFPLFRSSKTIGRAGDSSNAISWFDIAAIGPNRINRAGHQCKRFVFAKLSSAQLSHCFFRERVAREMKAADTFDRQDLAVRKQFNVAITTASPRLLCPSRSSKRNRGPQTSQAVGSA